LGVLTDISVQAYQSHSNAVTDH